MDVIVIAEQAKRLSRRPRASLTLLLLLVLSSLAWATEGDRFAPDNDWDALLKRHVEWAADGHASTVDYAGFAADHAALKRYLNALSAVSAREFEQWPVAKRRAFLINAYNAFTIELVLGRYPDLDSIRELGSWFRSPWQQKFFSLLGKTRGLDDVEHGLLRGAPDFDEPRIHFAVNCASVGCPALRPEAYRGDLLDQQLADQTRRFLSDRTRNRALPDTLQVSKLFDWYAEDFVQADSSLAAPLGFLAHHANSLDMDAHTLDRLRRGSLKLEYTDYDWSLNQRGAP